jgi:hypothetical protein
MAFSGMINVKSGQLTFGGQFEAYKRGQLERNIQFHIATAANCSMYCSRPNRYVFITKGNKLPCI